MDDPHFRVVAGTGPALAFEAPSAVLRGTDPTSVRAAFDRAEAALARGAWIAGYLTYEGAPALGVFEAPPVELALPDRAAEHSPLLPLVSRDEYARHVAEIQTAIYEGEVYQVNYTLPFALRALAHPFALYCRYARTTGARYQAYVEDGARALLAWSPELFLSFDGATIRTKPMKGTAALDRLHELEDEKNRAEHVMIVDLLRNDLRRICDDARVERFLEIERYPTFGTMTSTIEGRLRDGVSLAEVFAATFPCGSITGAPKRAAMQAIARHERQPRGAYCGTIGFLSPQRTGWWNVAIRTAQLDVRTGCGRFDAGGGIVADSSAAAEWDEVLLKAHFLRDGAPFALIETWASDADESIRERHLERMERSARAFGIPFDAAAVRAAFEKARAGRDGRRLVRVLLASGGAVRTERLALDAPHEPVRLAVAHERVASDDPFLRHKTTFRPAHDAAAARARALGCFDALLLNERGNLTEGARTNLFAEIDGRLWTPPLSDGALPGILRERIVSEGRARERTLTLADVRRADAVYAGNSARGLLRAELAE